MINMNKKGFTIVELVIVIAVIAILASVLIPTFSGVVGKANESAATQTARSTLTNALNMSSTAQLTGKNATNGAEKTVFLVDGYAFGYTGNQLVAIDYPAGSSVLKKGSTSAADNANNFNAILISSDNLPKAQDGSYSVKPHIVEIITKATDLESVTVTLVDGHYYVNYSATPSASWEAEIFVNSDFSNKVVVLTTFG